MSQDSAQEAEAKGSGVEIFESLLETLVSTLRDFNASSSCADLLDILKGLNEVYQSSEDETNKRELADLVAADKPVGTCAVIYGFISIFR